MKSTFWEQKGQSRDKGNIGQGSQDTRRRKTNKKRRQTNNKTTHTHTQFVFLR